MGALNTLLLLQYNNYFNRIIKSENSYSDYIQAAIKNKSITGVNFNPNDGVDTEQIINWNEDWNPDYMVLFNDETNLVSRWFVTEAVRTRGRQYKLTLKRDVISDYYNEVVNESPCFIQKGFVNANNVLVYNPEDIVTNQIKKDEKLLYDNTFCSWLVVYYNLNKEGELTGSTSFIQSPYIVYNGTKQEFVTAYSNYKETILKQYKIILDVERTSWGETESVSERYVSDIDSNIRYEDKEDHFLPLDLRIRIEEGKDSASRRLSNALKAKEQLIRSALEASFNNPLDLEEFLAYNGKIVRFNKDGGGYEFAKVNISPLREDVVIQPCLSGDSVFDALKSAFVNPVTGDFIDPWYGDEDLEDTFQTRITYRTYSVSLSTVDDSTISFSYDFTGFSLLDQPYGMFAMPYKPYRNDTLKATYDGDEYELNQDIPMAIARSLAEAGVGTDKAIFDIQILPYCPLVELTARDRAVGGILLETEESGQGNIKYILDNNDNPLTIAVFPSKAKFTKNIKLNKAEKTWFYVYTSNPVYFKRKSQTDFVRLCSPNYNGQFEFNVARNGGTIEYMNVDCTYKPYQPYIHINPDFKGLYGRDFNDPRGLICGGDFSITTVSNAFESYKLQNKNYQEIFNRQIDNLDTTQEISKEKAYLGVATGIAGGTYTGAKKGGAAGGPMGAVGGALVGGGISSAISALNIDWLERSQSEERDYRIDLHNYQLQNIKAIPDSLTKVDSFNNNNKIYPVLEFYSCTDEESDIFDLKLKYEGMTINALGFITNYIGPEQTFIKGQMIRIEGVGDDTHLLNAIYDEIAKGVYL